MNKIIELNDEFESSPFNEDNLKKNIFENESMSNYLIYNEFLIFLMSSDSQKKSEMNYLDNYMNPEVEDKFYLNLDLSLDENKINENILPNFKQKIIIINKEKKNIKSNKKIIKNKNMRIALYIDDIYNNQLLKNKFIQYLNKKRTHLWEKIIEYKILILEIVFILNFYLIIYIYNIVKIFYILLKKLSSKKKYKKIYKTIFHKI